MPNQTGSAARVSLSVFAGIAGLTRVNADFVYAGLLYDCSSPNNRFKETPCKG